MEYLNDDPDFIAACKLENYAASLGIWIHDDGHWTYGHKINAYGSTDEKFMDEWSS